MSSDQAKQRSRKKKKEKSMMRKLKKERSQVDGGEDVVCRDPELPELPQDVVASIQARLPLGSLQKSRAVCKAWDAAVESPWFLQERLESRARVRECMLFVVGNLSDYTIASCVYDPASDRWYKLELPPWLRLGDSRRAVQLSAGSAGGGVLLCDMRWPATKLKIRPYLGNPVAGSWAFLPELPDGLQIRDVVGMFVDATARSFKLVAIEKIWSPGEIGQPVPTFVFDSAFGRWNATTETLPDVGFSRRSDHGVFIGTVLYCVARVGCDLLAYDLEQASWRRLALDVPQLVIPHLFILLCNIVNMRGRLLAVVLCRRVGWVESWYNNSMEIWEVDFKSMNWMIVATMPAPVFAHFRQICFPPSRMEWMSQPADGIKVAAGQDLEIYILHDKLDKMVAVDLGQSAAAWRWLAPCPYEQFEGQSVHRLDPWLEFGTWKHD